MCDDVIDDVEIILILCEDFYKCDFYVEGKFGVKG